MAIQNKHLKNSIHSIWNSIDGKTRVNWKLILAYDTENLLEVGVGLANDGKSNKNRMPNIFQSTLIANRFAKIYRSAKPQYSIQKLYLPS